MTVESPPRRGISYAVAAKPMPSRTRKWLLGVRHAAPKIARCSSAFESLHQSSRRISSSLFPIPDVNSIPHNRRRSDIIREQNTAMRTRLGNLIHPISPSDLLHLALPPFPLLRRSQRGQRARRR